MSEYKSTYTGAQIDAGIALANTALQEHQSLAAYRTSSDQDTIDGAQNSHIGGLGNALARGGWNQLVQNGDFASTDGWNVPYSTYSSLSVSSNRLQITALQAPDNANRIATRQNITLTSGHKYYLTATFQTPNATQVAIGTNYNALVVTGNTQANTPSKIESIYTSTGASVLWFLADRNATMSANQIAYLSNVMCVNLTALFGAGNEPSSVADFRAMFPASYYSYHKDWWQDITSECTSPYTIVSAKVYDVNGLRMLNFAINNGTTGIPKSARIDGLVTWPARFKISNSLYQTTTTGNGSYNFTSYTSAESIPGYITGDCNCFVADPQNGIYANNSLNSSGNINCISLTITGIPTT